MSGLVLWMCCLVFLLSGLVFGCLDLYFVWPGPGPGQDRAKTGPGPGQGWAQGRARTGPGPGQDSARTGPGPGQDRARTGPGPGWGRARAGPFAVYGRPQKISTSQKIQHTIYFEMCDFVSHSLFMNFANMASPAEMTITTRTASKFCAKRRALQPPIFFLELISWVKYWNYRTLA